MSDREKVINDQQREIEELEERIAIILEGQPEIVRCKDCKYAMNFKNGFKYICDKEEIKIRDPNWFCADGERRDKDDG